jgi:hypothetical protein
LTDNIIERVEEIYENIVRLRREGKYCEDEGY